MEILIVLMMSVAITVAADGPPADVVNPATDPVVLGTTDSGIVIAMNSARPRRRRRPRRLGGKYEVVKVENGGAITGVVRFTGEVPKPETIQVVKDHETCDHREKTRAKVRAKSDGPVADVVVFLADIREGKAIPEVAEKHVIEQKHCTFVPHVQVLTKGQPFVIVNNDPVAHNAQCVQNMVTLFNPVQPQQGMRNEFKIKRPGLATITCAVHNWMQAYAYVLWHPYYDMTGTDGAFTIDEIPPGEYKVIVWQEHVGQREETVTVEAGETTRLDIDLSGE